MNDPLLNQPWGPPTDPAQSEMPAPSARDAHPAGGARVLPPKRAKHPAASSRILAVGFSVAAVIGMSAAYTRAQQLQPSEPEKFDTASNSQLNFVPSTPIQQQPPVQRPQNNVVQIPIPQASPATGGYAPQNQGPVQQQSNGSH